MIRNLDFQTVEAVAGVKFLISAPFPTPDPPLEIPIQTKTWCTVSTP